jgi:hypothetical protein
MAPSKFRRWMNRRVRNCSKCGYRARIEALEDRILPATYTVRLPGDDAFFNPQNPPPPDKYTLRDAVGLANFHGGGVVAFNLPAGQTTINLLGVLPLTAPITIDGSTQPGFNGKPVVVLDGVIAGINDAIDIHSNGSTVRDLVFNDYFGSDIAIYGNNNTIQGNFIGTDASGTAPEVNEANQIVVEGAHNTIGGTTAAERNVISGDPGYNVPAVVLYLSGATGNIVEGNYIGTDLNGTKIVGNAGTAIWITGGASNNTIGGTVSGAGNVISGNVNSSAGQSGGFTVVQIDGKGTNANVVAGNFIGTDSTGKVALGNGGAGVLIDGGAAMNTIGGTTTGARNVISGNKSDGIDVVTGSTKNVVEGNYIGITSLGSAPLANAKAGVVITAPGNTIGGTSPAARNIISGNELAGVQILTTSATGNIVEGNSIGTDPSGMMSLPNHTDGVDIASGATSNTVGGDTAHQGNLISGNTQDGVLIFNSNRNAVQGNFIGTDIHGDVSAGPTNPLANLNGVSINGGSNNTIGATTDAGVKSMNDGSRPNASSNLIRGNKQDGVLVNGMAAGNRISLNVIYGDSHMGIDLGGTITTLEAANGWQA